MGTTSYEFPAEHSRFLADFQALLDKHAGAADRFVLADVKAGALAMRGLRRRLPELDCVSTEWGMVCKFEKLE